MAPGGLEASLRKVQWGHARSRPVAAELGSLAIAGLGQLALLLAALRFASEAPLRAGARFAWPRAEEMRPLLPAFALYWLVVAVHLALVQLDPALTAWVGRDYAQTLYNLEGDAVAWFQTLRHPVLDAAVLGVYLLGYPFMISFAPLYYALHRDARALRLAALSFAVLYALTLPLYVLAPVSNPWAVAQEPWYHGRPVAFVLGEAWPGIVDSYWRFTTPNNEVPSLHAAISLMVALVAWRSGRRRLAWLTGFFAAAIPPASFYLGVHWLLDAGVGWVFALVSVGAGLWLAARWERGAAPRPRSPRAAESDP